MNKDSDIEARCDRTAARMSGEARRPCYSASHARVLAGLLLLAGVAAPATLALTLGLMASPADAQLAAEPDRPTFSAAERSIIARNASLRDKVSTEPWLVRRVLDTLAHRTGDATRSALPAPATRDLPLERRFDTVVDPDLGSFERASPEAASDLFQLIKKAGAANQPAPAK